MDLSWARIKEAVLGFWNKLSRPQRIITVVAPLAVAIALIVLLSWASQTQYVMLFTKLSDVEAGTITEELKELKVNYKLADNGSTILVPEQSAAEIRLQLANSGLPSQSKFSFDYLNTMHLGETDADRKLRYQLGLQTELETTLRFLNGVEDARVNITIPEQSLFVESQKETTAVATLKLMQGKTLSEEQIRSVANLLVGSVEGLQLENITIIDTDGNYLSDVLGENYNSNRLTEVQFQMQRLREENIRRSVQSMLDQVYGPGKTVVRINAELDFDNVKITRQIHGPGAVVSEQKTSEVTANGIDAGGIPGVTENGIPNYLTPTDDTTYYSSATSETINHEPDTTQEEQETSPGKIKRLSISVMADDETVTQEQLDPFQAAVASAAGYNPERGDQIQVALIPFDKSALLQAQADRERAEQRQRLMYYALAVAAVLFLIGLLVFLILRWRRNKRAEELALEEARLDELSSAELLDQLTGEEGEPGLGAQSVLSELEKQKQKIREAIESYAKNNPEEVARLMKTWLAEER